MEYRTLGRTGLNVSLLSYGTGGYSILGQTAGLTHKQQDALIARALDGGINLFDTSPQYRQSEDILGRTLAGVARDSYVMVTKWNHDLWGQAWTRPWWMTLTPPSRRWSRALRVCGPTTWTCYSFTGYRSASTPRRWSASTRP